MDIAVFDAASEFGVAMSDNFRLDYTRPTGSLTRPTGTTNVPTDTTIEITFSEAMDTASTWTAVSITPTVPGLSPVWTSGNSVLTIGHGALNANTQYTVTVTTGAKDACNPGLTMASSYQRQFTTGSGLNAPQAPRNVRVTSNTSSGATVQWDAPLFWQDGTPLIESDITTYTVYRSSTASCAGATSAGPSLTKAFTDSGLTAGTTYYYCVTATASGHEGAFGGPAEALTSAPPPPESFNWLLVAIPLIVIVLLIVAFLLLRRKKPAAAPPKGGAAARTSPREEPAEEEPEASPASARQDTGDEGREKFIPCPNCGTMVKPTDAECFVCGAKL